MSGVILVADDHPLFLSAVIDGLAAHLPAYRFACATSLDGVLDGIAADRPALLLLDLDIPGATGLDGLAAVLAGSPGLPVAILSASTAPELVTGAMTIGARGYFPKSLDLDLLAEGVTAVLAGELRTPGVFDAAVPDDFLLRYATLSPQQCRVLNHIADGLLNKQIAGLLGISEQRVKEHVTLIFRRLNVSSRIQAAIAAQRLRGAATEPGEPMP